LLPRGGARLFPSRAIHRVTPVTRGVRHALVAWTGRRG
jgi:PKHD-type hydroxylase